LNRKETKIRDLQAQYDDVNANDATLDQEVETRSRKCGGCGSRTMTPTTRSAG
jgi:hypothetical protein